MPTAEIQSRQYQEIGRGGREYLQKDIAIVCVKSDLEG